MWTWAGDAAPDAAGQVVVDLDGVLVIAHSEKQDAAATWKKTFGHHPLMGFVDHGRGGAGEPVATLLRPRNAGSSTAADHIEAARLALAQLPKKYRRGRPTLIRTDSGGGTHEFVEWLSARARWLSYSLGMTITDAIHEAVVKVPASAWTPAVEPDGEARDGAWVAELDGDCLKGWPEGMRLVVRRERPHAGAQLRFTDADGHRLTCFATNTADEAIAALELRPGSGLGPRTAFAPPAPPACATSLSTTPHRTRSGWRSSRSPWTCWPGCPCSPSPAKPADGSPPPAAAAVLRGRPTRHQWTPPHPPPRQTLALDQRDHRRPATAHGPAEPRLTSTFPPLRAGPPDRSRGTRRHPTRQPGHHPTHRQKTPPRTSRKGPSAS